MTLPIIEQNYYGVATVSRIDKIIGFLCRILSRLQGSFAKENYNFIDPTNQSQPMCNEMTSKVTRFHEITRTFSHPTHQQARVGCQQVVRILLLHKILKISVQ